MEKYVQWWADILGCRCCGIRIKMRLGQWGRRDGVDDVDGVGTLCLFTVFSLTALLLRQSTFVVGA